MSYVALILSSLYFILPAYFANMCPVILKKLPSRPSASGGRPSFSRDPPPAGNSFGQPINAKLFGENKTYRGFYTAYIGALIMLALQKYIGNNPAELIHTLLDYEKINIFSHAFLFGIGAMTGDLVKSFFKRRLGIKEGAPFIPFDQIDFIIGALIFLFLYNYIFSMAVIITLLLMTPLLHFLANIIAYKLGLKRVWW